MRIIEEFQLDVVSVRLVSDSPVFSEHKIIKPQDAVDVIGKILCEMDREVVCLVNLKSDGTPINCHFASMGALDKSIVHPRELFKASILSNACKMLLLHSHPSGNLCPSKEDTVITDRLLQLSELMEIPLLDHIIVGGDNSRYFSFKEKGMIQNSWNNYKTNYELLDFDSSCAVAEQGEKKDMDIQTMRKR